MRRLHQTLADYVVIAISPALIMALVGSLVYFLLAVFYQGEFQARLHWVMACFVFAIVLIGRISIEEGFERAAPFGAALAILVGIAANRFMEYHGTWIDQFGWIVNFALIGVVWWCAHQLTWDCTVIDDSQDASGEGLVQVAGLERPADERNEAVDRRRVEGTTDRQVPASYWQRYVEHQRRPHAPGVWVVYFSLAALPIFGFGQLLIPAARTGQRRYAFWLAGIYMAAALGLLLTTSFLGLRRYLRQRRIEMPTLMANLWLGTGTAIVLVLLVAAALLPRPGAEYEISQLAFSLGSPSQRASRSAPLEREGTADAEHDTAPSREQPSGEARPDNSAPSPEQAADGQAVRAENEASRSQSDGKNARGDAEQKERSDAHPQQPAPMQDRGPTDADTGARARQPPSDSAPESPERETAPRPDSSPTTQQVFEAVAPPTVSLLLWLRFGFYLVFALVALWALWSYRLGVVGAIAGFLAELRAFWARLFGLRPDRRTVDEGQLDIELPPPPFASFADPFAGGLADRFTPEELVRYSFEAFEAWSREHGCTRGPEQTPHELARDVGRSNRFIADESRGLAELYARAAYARGGLPPDSGARLQRLWAKMRVAASRRDFPDELPSQL